LGCEFPAFDFGQATPDTVRLANIDGRLQTIAFHRTGFADGFRPDLAPFPFVFPFKRAWWEEEMRMVTPAECSWLPIACYRRHRHSSSSAKRGRNLPVAFETRQEKYGK
jgi:hypothetical protein